MLPGPYYIYKCPNCDNLLRKSSLMSGNTLGLQIFSDGKNIRPMLPEFPDLTKCKKCNTIFQLSKLKHIGTYEWWDDKIKSRWKNADQVDFLDIEDYFRVLNEGFAKDIKEVFIRKQIWWAYNDRIRYCSKTEDNVTPFVDANDEIRWRENCNKLIPLLSLYDLDERIMIAELKRNLGDFEACIYIIEQIWDYELNWLKDIFINECKKGNRWVVQLK